MYIGEHELDFKSIEELLKNTLKKANLDLRDETLYGLMLYYSKYFILTLEVSKLCVHNFFHTN